MKIIISPWSKKQRNGKPSPKNYPHWKELIELIGQEKIIQIGLGGEEKLVDDCRFGLNFEEIDDLICDADMCVSIDNMFQHLCWFNERKCVVLFGISDPEIFGHEDNVNLLKSRKYLRQNQFGFYEDSDYCPEAFLDAETVYKKLKELNKNL